MTILARGAGPAAACAEVPALLLLLVLVVVGEIYLLASFSAPFA